WVGSGIPYPGVVSGAPLNGPIYVRYNDGSGDALYAVGANMSGSSADPMQLMKWDGSAWSIIGAQLPFPSKPTNGPPSGFPSAAVVFDVLANGHPWLIIAGNATSEDSSYTSPPNVFAWDGSAWQTIGDGLSDVQSDTNRVNSLAVCDSKLYAGGGVT